MYRITRKFRNNSYILFISAIMLFFASCTNNKIEEQTPANEKAEPDSMIYGLSCDGTNDTVVVFLPFSEGADPITYNIEEAKAKGHVYGQLEMGDWVGIIVNPEDSTEAIMAISLDKLKGTWTHEVRPTWKETSKLSARALKKNFAEMPDSIKDAYLIPREYGFTLKRSSQASPVGYVRKQSSLESDSPVEYPSVKHYKGWKVRNGHLVLTSVDRFTEPNISNDEKETKKESKEYHDTLDFVFMNNDSLVLRTSKNEIISFHRKESSRAANREAEKAVQKIEQKTLK